MEQTSDIWRPVQLCPAKDPKHARSSSALNYSPPAAETSSYPYDSSARDPASPFRPPRSRPPAAPPARRDTLHSPPGGNVVRASTSRRSCVSPTRARAPRSRRGTGRTSTPARSSQSGTSDTTWRSADSVRGSGVRCPARARALPSCDPESPPVSLQSC